MNTEITLFPRLLIFSNSCLSDKDSNGRTLKNFLIGWDKNKIAQFYIQNSCPDFDVCEKYYRVSDSQALKSFLRRRPYGGEVTRSPENGENTARKTKKRRRNAVTMLLRDFVWNRRKWMGEEFEKWVSDFSPQLILMQAGDNPFLMRLATDVAKQYNIPLIIYNSEVYYFKKYDYFRSGVFSKMFYPLFHKYFCKQFDNTVKYAKMSIYNCEMIQQAYDEKFSLPSTTIYTASTLNHKSFDHKTSGFVVSYLGNLGVGRHEALIDIANELQKISPEYKLDVYGKIPNQEVEDAFDKCNGISYKGFVSYSDVIRIMKESDLLVHVENFSKFYKKDLQYAFSTKIADSLSVGNCFLLYAPEEMACSKYLTQNDVAYVANDKTTLGNILEKLSESSEARKKYLSSALEIAEKNHNFYKNAKEFQRILLEAEKTS